jgi:hypothetical protein
VHGVDSNDSVANDHQADFEQREVSEITPFTFSSRHAIA